MAYDETTARRTADEKPSDTAAYRSNGLTPQDDRRRSDQPDDASGEPTNDLTRRSAADEAGRDRLGIHLGWEVVLLLGAAALAVLLWRVDPDAFQRPALDVLLITGAAIGLLTMGGGLSLRAGVPNLALGPIALAAALQYAEQGDRGLWKAVVPALVIAAAGAAVVALLILVLHVPGWAATFAAALGVVVFNQLRTAPVAVQGEFDPTSQAFFVFGGFALLSVLGGALGTVAPLRRWMGLMRPSGDPARRRGPAVVIPVLVALVLSSVFAVVAGVLTASVATAPIEPGTGLEWSGIALGLAMLAGTSAYGRRGGIFGTLLAVIGLTLFLDYAGRKDLHISLFAIAACLFGAGLIVTRLVETFGRPLSPSSDDWDAAPAGTGGNWSPHLPETWSGGSASTRTERWDDGPWGSSR